MKTRVKFIAVCDSRPQPPIFLSSDHPRKELLERLHAKNAQKVYIDDSNGQPQHVGYYVQGTWYTLYHVDSQGPTKERTE